jgi:CRP/FNR family cyclic AMP-dependent transcriptional regulator
MRYGNPAEVLAKSPHFAQLDARERELMLQAIRVKHFGARDAIYWEGEPGDMLFIVVSGYAKAISFGVAGREIGLYVFGPGEFFGELSVFDREPRSVSVTALEATELAMLDRDSLLRLIDVSPRIARVLLEAMAGRLRAMVKRYGAVASMGVSARLADMLVTLAERHGQWTSKLEVCIPIRLSQQDLGNLVGVTRESVNKQLKYWMESGLVRQQRGRLWIANIETFRNSASVFPASPSIGFQAEDPLL